MRHIDRNNRRLDPHGTVSNEIEPLAEWPQSIEGATIGFLDHAKGNADHSLDEVARTLCDEHGVLATIHHRKSYTATPTDSIGDYLHEQCDAVVNAYGDCGSCTSWCVYDSVDLEQRGTPVATINSKEFVRLGQSECRSLGMPGRPLVTVPHPMGGVSKDIVRKRARDTVPTIVRVLTSHRGELPDEFKGKYLGSNEELRHDELRCPL